MIYLLALLSPFAGLDVDEMNSMLAEASVYADPAPSEWWSGDTLIQPLDGEAGFWGGDLAVMGAWEWVQWPSQEYLDAHLIHDRSSEFPPIYLTPKHQEMGFGPYRSGASAPIVGIARLGRVIRGRLCEDAIGDYRDRLADLVTLVQDENPADSLAFVRFDGPLATIQGTAEQWGLCLLVRPLPDDYTGLDHLDFGREVFRRLFVDGDALADRPLRPLEGAPEGISMFVPTDDWGRELRHWSLWYTDGKTVAVFFCTFDWRDELGQRFRQPWF